MHLFSINNLFWKFAQKLIEWVAKEKQLSKDLLLLYSFSIQFKTKYSSV